MSEVNASLRERERIAARIAELERENDATPSWGAAVGARIEEIRSLRRRLAIITPFEHFDECQCEEPVIRSDGTCEICCKSERVALLSSPPPREEGHDDLVQRLRFWAEQVHRSAAKALNDAADRIETLEKLQEDADEAYQNGFGDGYSRGQYDVGSK
jgi:hypothetical protein